MGFVLDVSSLSSCIEGRSPFTSEDLKELSFGGNFLDHYEYTAKFLLDIALGERSQR